MAVIKWFALGIVVLTCAACTILETSSPAPPRQYQLGGGTEGGLYAVVARHLTRLTNAEVRETGFLLEPRESEGSVENLKQVAAGKWAFGLAQNDCQWEALHGKRAWAERGPQPALRSVVTLFPEMVTLVARDEAEIYSLSDLRGKKILIGPAGSGHHQNARDVLKAAGLWGREDMEIEIEENPFSEALRLLRQKKVDALFYTGHHPHPFLETLASAGPALHFVPLAGLNTLVQPGSRYHRAFISHGLYTGFSNQNDIPGIAIYSGLVASESTPEDLAYTVTRAVFENLDTLRLWHPVYEGLTSQSLQKRCILPLHPGALRYYKEKGWDD